MNPERSEGTLHIGGYPVVWERPQSSPNLKAPADQDQLTSYTWYICMCGLQQVRVVGPETSSFPGWLDPSRCIFRVNGIRTSLLKMCHIGMGIILSPKQQSPCGLMRSFYLSLKEFKFEELPIMSHYQK